jgi:hypothetical protein
MAASGRRASSACIVHDPARLLDAEPGASMSIYHREPHSASEAHMPTDPDALPRPSSRRSFLRHSVWGLTGSLMAAGVAPLRGQQAESSLKIVKVEPILLTGLRGSAPWVFVRVETADGYVGWGEGTNYPGVRPIASAVSTLSSVVIGRSAWDIEALWQRMYRFMYYNGMGGVVLAAISGIDMALYDIVGKKLGVPVYKILGGQVHEKLRTYANGWTDGLAHTPEAYAARTKELVARGYTGNVRTLIPPRFRRRDAAQVRDWNWNSLFLQLVWDRSQNRRASTTKTRWPTIQAQSPRLASYVLPDY